MSAILKETKFNTLFLTLNRPDSMNAINSEMINELTLAMDEAVSNELRCIVLKGSGKGFCSGQDLKDFEKENKSFKQALENKYNPLIKKMMELPKPIICGINGVAAGAGLSLALACDFRIAAETASLIEIFVNVGLVPDSASTYTLPRIVGLSKAFRMSSFADKITAIQAKELGLVNVVVSNTEVLEIALERYAKKFASLPTKAIGIIKNLLNTSFECTLEDALRKEADMQDAAGNSDDYKEGLNAFLEKRKPKFTGK